MNKRLAAMVVGGAAAVLAVAILSSDHLRVRYTLHALHRAVEDEDVASSVDLRHVESPARRTLRG